MFAPDLTEGRLNCAGSRGGEFKSLHTTVSPACAGRVLRLRWKLFCYFPLLEGVLHLLRSVSLLEAWGFTWTLKRLCKQSNPPGWHISVCHCQVCSPTPYRFKGTENSKRAGQKQCFCSFVHGGTGWAQQNDLQLGTAENVWTNKLTSWGLPEGPKSSNGPTVHCLGFAIA